MTQADAFDPAELPDRIVVVENGRERVLTVQEFLSIPVHVRVRHVLAQSVAFHRGNAELPRSVALQILMRYSAATVPSTGNVAR